MPKGRQLTIKDVPGLHCDLCERPTATGVAIYKRHGGAHVSNICDGCVEEIVEHARPTSHGKRGWGKG